MDTMIRLGEKLTAFPITFGVLMAWALVLMSVGDNCAVGKVPVIEPRYCGTFQSTSEDEMKLPPNQLLDNDCDTSPQLGLPAIAIPEMHCTIMICTTELDLHGTRRQSDENHHSSNDAVATCKYFTEETRAFTDPLRHYTVDKVACRCATSSFQNNGTVPAWKCGEEVSSTTTSPVSTTPTVQVTSTTSTTFETVKLLMTIGFLVGLMAAIGGTLALLFLPHPVRIKICDHVWRC